MTGKPRALLTVLGLAALALTCHQALFTAPGGSTLSLIANPTFIPANTGISVITAIIYDATGSPVADGTVVQFFTDLGRIDEQGRTNDGVARVNLYADSRSGTATVTAISGTGAAGGGGGGTPSPTASATTTGIQAPGGGVKAGQAGAAIAASDTIAVTIGSANPVAVFATANPQRITSPRFTTITANVFAANGNPVSNVPVFFEVTLPGSGEPLLQETLDSGGAPQFTDNNGRATDILRTSYDPAEFPKTVTVHVTLPVGNLSDDVTVIVN